MHPTDLLADLPPPSDDEPPSLRSDIVDELLDHLQCAFRREVLKDGDEAAAERRVLDRFGDPKKLARRLWWQAMWSRIMGKRILSGLQWLVSLAAVVLAGAVFWQQSRLLKEMADNQNAENHWRQNLSLTLNDLRSRLPATATANVGNITDEPTSGGGGAGAMSPMMGGGAGGPAMSDAPSLTVKLVQGTADGPPVTLPIKEISLTTGNRTSSGIPQQAVLAPGSSAMMMSGGGPMASGAMPGGLTLASADGCFTFNNLEPDRYELKITLEDGQFTTQPVVIRDTKPRHITIVCPPPRERVPVTITATPLPPDLRAGGWTLSYVITEARISTGKSGWDGPDLKTHMLHFDPETGQLLRIVSGVGLEMFMGGMGGMPAPVSIDVSQSDFADRVVFLATGPITARYQLTPPPSPAPREGERAKYSVTFPPFTADQSAQTAIQRTVERDQLEWKLDLPEELLALARQQMEASQSSAGTAKGKATSKRSASDDDIRSADELESVMDEVPATLGGNAKGRRSIPLRGSKARTQAIQSAPLGDHCRLIVKLTSETKDGPVPQGARVFLNDERGKPGILFHNGERNHSSGLSPNDEGQCVFGLLEPGRYQLMISFDDGRHLSEKLRLLRPGEERTEQIICPPAVKKAIAMVTAPPLPEDLRQPGVRLETRFVLIERAFEGKKWTLTKDQEASISFDSKAGLPEYINGINQQDVTPEDRFVLLPVGGYFEMTQLNFQNPKTRNSATLATKTKQGMKPDFTVQPGENKWEIKVSDEFWTEARKQLSEVLAPRESRGADEPATPKDAPPSDSPGAKTDDDSAAAKTDGKMWTLTVKLVQEDNSPVGGAELTATANGKRWQAEPDKLFKNVGKNENGVPVGVRVETGKYHFDFNRADRYDLSIKLQDGQTCRQSIVVKDKEQEFLVVCPPPRDKVSMLITAPPLPGDLQDAGFELSCWIVEEPVTVNSSQWSSSTPRTVLTFNARTGEPKTLGLYDDAKGGSQQIDLQKTPLEERLVFLPSGPVGVRFNLYNYQKEESKAGQLQVHVIWPPTAGISKVNKPPLPRNVDPDETRWKLELPEELLTQVRKKLAEKDGVPRVTVEGDDPGNSPGDKTDSSDEFPADASKPSADSPNQDAPDEDVPKKSKYDPAMGQLQIQVVTETDGRPLKEVDVLLLDRADPSDVRHRGVTDRQGAVTLNALNSDKYYLQVISRQTGFYAFQDLTVRAVEQMTKLVMVPSNIASCQVKMTTNLPQDLADQGIRLCLMSRGVVNPQFFGTNLLQWNAGLGGATWFEPLVIGSEGCEGRLTGRQAWSSTDFNPRTIAAELKPVTQSRNGLICPAVQQFVVSMALIRSSPVDADKEMQAQWEVYAAPEGVDGKKIDFSGQLFTPHQDEPNVWQIEIPDEMIAAARNKLVERPE